MRRSRDGQVIFTLLGGLLLPCAVLLLCWNEASTLRSARSLAEGAAVTVEAPPDRIDAALDGRLVHVTGAVTLAQPLRDPEFGVTLPGAVRLRRTVQAYQWQEETSGRGGTTTYRAVWSDRVIDSRNFKQPDVARNPPPRFVAQQMQANVSLGPYRLHEVLVQSMEGWQAVRLRPDILPAGAQLDGSNVYVGSDPAHAQVGDLRIAWEAVTATEVSIVAEQRDRTLATYRTAAGRGIALIRSGPVPAREMIALEREGEASTATGLRVFGVLLLFLAFWLAGPFPLPGRLADIPAAGRAGMLAASTGIVVIAAAWVVVRGIG